MITVRPATADDERFLREMLAEAAPDAAPDDPMVARYVNGWGRRGDAGVVAVGGQTDGARLGAAWVRLLPGDAPGYGYVGDDVPELSMAVHPTARGVGVGRLLLAHVLRAARSAGHAQVSLSVDPANAPARHLYEDAGFVPVGTSGTSITMLKSFEESGP